VSADSRKQKRKQVLAAARRVLEQVGIRKLTLEDVAERAGLATSSLYYYFANKSDLVRAIAAVEMSEVLQTIEQNVAAAEGFDEKVAAVGRTILLHARHLTMLPGLSRSERMAFFPEVQQEAEHFKARVREIVCEIIEQGNRAEVFAVAEPEMAAFVIVAGLRGLADSVLDGEINEDRFSGVDRMSRLLMDGLRRR